MFTTEKVPSYLNNFSGIGEDEKKEIKLSIYVTPISYELANEVSPQIADRIFRKFNDEWTPALEVGKTSFIIGQIPPQRVTFLPHEDSLVEMFGILLENAHITGIEARKAWPDKPDFRLEFVMTVPMDENSMTIIRRYYKEKVLLTMFPMQPTLFDKGQIAPGQVERCKECQEPASYVDSEKGFHCQKHVRQCKGEAKLIVKKETPKEAEERVMREKATPETPVEDIKDPKVQEGAFINERASKKGASKRVH